MMKSFFADYLERLADINVTCIAAFADLPSEAICWRPGPEMNSIAIIVTHMAGAQRYWIGDVAAGEPSDRVRADEFIPTETDAKSLKKKLDDSLTFAEQTLDRFDLGDLEMQRISIAHDRQFTGSWALLHALEHSAQHCGHVQLTSQLWRLNSAL